MLGNSRHLPPRAALIAIATIAILGATLAVGALHHSVSKTAVAQSVAPGRVPPTTTAPPTAAEAASSTPSANRVPYTGSPALGAPGVAGMVVGIDPETGALGPPSKADRAALARAANMSPALDRSDAGLTVIHRPDGSMMVDLQGRFQDYAVMRIAPDGTKRGTCVQESGLDAALRGDPAPAPISQSAQPEPPHEDR